MGSSRKALLLKQISLLALFATLWLIVDADKDKKTEQEFLAASQKIIDQHLQLDRPTTVKHAHKDKKTEQKVFVASKDVDQHLKPDRPSNESTNVPFDTFVEIIKFAWRTVKEDLDSRVAYANKMSSLNLHGTLHKGGSSDNSYNKVASSTEQVYSKAKHTTEVSTNAPKTIEQLNADFKNLLRELILHGFLSPPKSTVTLHEAGEERSSDSYSKVASSTTPGYSKDQHTSEVSSNVSKQTSTADAYSKSTSTTTAAYSKDKHSVGSSQNEKPTKDVLSTTPLPSSSAVPRPPSLVGSISGVPGINFPDYTDIPITSFTCADKAYLPGFYADLETGCQVFHVCWQNRRESFLCPLGTTFNQALLACDYWYSTNCSLAPHYYDVNEESSPSMSTKDKSPKKSMVDVLLEKSEPSVDASPKSNLKPDAVLSIISKFLPVKAKVVMYPETDKKRAKIVASTSLGKEEVVHQEEGEQKPLKVQKPTSKPEVSQVDFTSEGKVVHKTHHIKDELKPLKEDFKAFDLAAEKLFSNILDIKRLYIAELKHLYEMGMFGKELKYKTVEPAYKSELKIVKVPEITQKPRVLTKLNPRFIVKPASPPEVKKGKHVKAVPSEEDSKIRVVPEITQKPSVLTKLNSGFIVKPVSPPEVKKDKHVKATPSEEDSKIRVVPEITQKPSVLTKPNSGFIVKPVSPPEVKKDKHVKAAPSEKDSKRRVVHVRVPKSTWVPKSTKEFKMQKVHNQYSGMKISPETKEAIAKNYLAYMQTRKPV